ncbi:MAG: hypothetical protein M1269_02755 [Chloroflexi bacterium]|nr:hypothetical protein [Chloroflexota bacterium]
MSRSISIVEYKVQQAHFFLEKIGQAELDLFAVQCFVDAFAGAARSITFSIQAVISDVLGFAEWYRERQSVLKDDVMCQFFNQYRRVSTHIGDTVVRGGIITRDHSGERVTKYFFMPIPDLPVVPQKDVLSICTDHFKTLLDVVYDAILTFKYQLDDRWYFTLENFCRLGKTVEDAEEELGFPRGGSSIGGVFSECERWKALRCTQTVGCQLNELFLRYLGKTIQGPDDDTEQVISPYSEPVARFPQG